MSLSGAAAALGLPEALVQRSAAARAAETGQSVDEILAAWAGGETIAAPAAAAAEPSQPEPTEAETTTAPDMETVPPVVAAATATTPAAAGPVTRKPPPDEVTPGEAAHLPEVVTVPTAGIRERTNFTIPRWLTALMVVAPLFALFALGGSSTGACGEATELTTDVITGEIVNCDGSEFTGGGAGGGGGDFIGMGEDIYMGAAVAGVNCAGCHGPNGQGSGAFPPLTGVLTTFGACADHIEWVTLGSAGFAAEGVYGDTNKPVQTGMPAFGGTLSPEQIAAVSAFERVRFGGGDPDTVLADCGLAEPEGGEGEVPTDGQPPIDGEPPTDGTTGTTVPVDAEASAELSG